MRLSLALVALAALHCGGCAGPATVPAMASARIASDFETYAVRRVGFVPFRPLGRSDVAPHEVEAIETSFHAEFAVATPYDIVPLRGEDLAEVLEAEPFRRGWYPPASIVALRDRYRLDAVFIGSVTARRLTPPLVLGVQLDLVSCETGQTIWSSDVLVDASQGETREALDVWAQHELGEHHAAEIALLSPRKFAHFAAYQLARTL
ncbi:MAG: hypothetical protein AAF726_16745 [Planctomycetota bacterium]